MAQHYIIGIDEAGRGPWAGPVVVGGFLCGVDFDFSVFSPLLDDSKKMKVHEREDVFSRIEKVIGGEISEKLRPSSLKKFTPQSFTHQGTPIEEIFLPRNSRFGEISREVCRYHFAYRDASDIDTLGIREANRQAMEEVILSLLQFLHPTDTIEISIDGCDNYRFSLDRDVVYQDAVKKNAKTQKKNIFEDMDALCHLRYIIGGDGLIPVISTASVVAKVIRDRMMCEYGEEFPEYGFADHKGYGTRKHREALLYYGITPIHRKSYAPVKALISG